jgi:ADP-ribosylglycohydrolase
MGGPYEGSAGPVEISDTNEWRISDDTQLTLATCEAIANSGKVDGASIADSFTEWFRGSLITGVGASTLKALTELNHGSHYVLHLINEFFWFTAFNQRG